MDIGFSKDVVGSERAQWGLASLLIGALSTLSALTTLIFNVILWQTGLGGLPKTTALVGTLIGLVVVLGLTGFGIAAGVKGRNQAHFDSHPSPLATAGFVTGCAAMILWLMVGIDLLMILAPFVA
jgi:hypothetical protein